MPNTPVTRRRQKQRGRDRQKMQMPVGLFGQGERDLFLQALGAIAQTVIQELVTSRAFRKTSPSGANGQIFRVGDQLPERA
jgi:hypothetical protein